MINTNSIFLQQNRHSALEPYIWFGPDLEPNKAGKNCTCIGCEIAVAIGRHEVKNTKEELK